MRFQFLNESRDEKLFANIRLWYEKYGYCLNRDNKTRKRYYLDFKPSEYDSCFDRESDFNGFIYLAEFLFTECSYTDCSSRGYPEIVKYYKVHTPEYVKPMAFAAQHMFGSDVFSYCDTLGLDDLHASFDFAIALHKYIVRNCMDESKFFYVYTQGDSRRFEPDKYFNPETRLEDNCNAEFDYRKQKPVVADGNWIRVRDEFGFLKDAKGKNFI